MIKEYWRKLLVLSKHNSLLHRIFDSVTTIYEFETISSNTQYYLRTKTTHQSNMKCIFTYCITEVNEELFTTIGVKLISDCMDKFGRRCSTGMNF